MLQAKAPLHQAKGTLKVVCCVGSVEIQIEIIKGWCNAEI